MVIRNVRENEGAVLLEVLDHLRKNAQGSKEAKVHVLVATDHDGVCAQLIFDILLQKYQVTASFYAVTGNMDIIKHIQSRLDADSPVRSLVLLNCGASLDLAEKLDEFQAPEDLKCYVIDAHRPVLIANIKERNNRVYVLDDDPIIDEENKLKIEETDSEAEDLEGNDDEGKENEWDFNGSQMEFLTADIGRERKRRRLQEREDKRRSKRERIHEYYLHSYYAMPAAMSLFKMARQASKPTADLLWLAAVSLVGYLDLGLMNEMHYVQLAETELYDILEQTTESYPASQHSIGEDDETSSSAPPPRDTHSSKEQKRSLRFERDLRLTMYTHWTLEDSMKHSSYFYGVMELHRDRGQRALKEFFAASGIAPDQHSGYKQMYRGMDMPIKKRLPQLFHQHGKAFGLNDKMFLQQFVRDLGANDTYTALNLNEVSAIDAAHLINALLCRLPASLGSAQVDQLPKGEDGRRDAEAVDEEQRKALVASFNRAKMAALCQESGLVREGISEAIKIAQAVQTLARFVIDTKAMRLSNNGIFRWCKIEQPPDYFRHHVNVRKLAVWLLKVLFQYRPKHEGVEKPLLLIVRDHVRETYLCVGATPEKEFEQNDFGEQFRTVLRNDKTIKFRYDFFDKSCIEISADDFDRFWNNMVDSIA